MARYIDADALIERLTRMWESRQLTNTKYKCFTEMLIAEPTADVVEAPKWIPVTERLPEKDGMYLVSISPQSRMEKRVDTDFYSHFGIWQIFGKFVTAWRELPEPYKEATDAQLV